MLTRQSPADTGSRSPRLERSTTALFVLLATLVSCAHRQAAGPAAAPAEIPGAYTLYGETAPAPDRWWEGFGSAELSALVEEAMQGSLTLRQSLARLEQSRALAVQAGADRLPDLRLTAGASQTTRKTDDGTVRDRSRSLSLVSSYEVDFWGRVRARHLSALQEFEASREDLNTAALTLASEVTLKWLELLSVRQQLTLLDEQLATNRTILDLMELRYLKGAANALDIYQQRQAVAETEAAFPQLEARLRTVQNELAALLGKPPGTDLGLSQSEFPEVGALPETGVPADLLSRRPDVRASGLELMAARGQVAAARADRLPAVNLTGTAGYSSDRWSDLLDSWLLSLAANLTAPLFDAGSRKAEVARREAMLDERLASYGQTVLGAIGEVEDALVRETKQVQYIEALREQLRISRDGYREALSRYRKGLSDYLPVLSALTGTQRLERSIVQARLERLSQRVELHRALGGGWMDEKLRDRITERSEGG
ncbi:MAG: efflux transporter outer membrane subunit [bacterium]|nr:MAG: efflux transporter outer membrane subunit [bacterium]